MKSLSITYQDQKFIVSEFRKKLTIGRGEFNDLVMRDPAISELHGQITFLNGTFIYKDLKSKNGTLILDNRGHSRLLKNSEQELSNHGTIFPGSRSGPGLNFSVQEDNNLYQAALLQKKGVLSLKKNDHDQALNIFNILMRQSPEDIDLYYYAGFAAWKLNRLDEAALRFEQYLMIRRQDGAVMTDLGKIYERMAKIDKAREWYAKAVKAGEKTAEKMIRELQRYRGYTTTLSQKFTTVDLLSNGEKSVHQSPHFTVTYFHEHLDILKTVLKTLESAYRNTGATLEFFPVKKIPVQLIANNSQPCGRTTSKGITLYLSAYNTGEKKFLPVLVNHEYCHYALGTLTEFSLDIPWWFHEGLAQFMSQNITPGRLLLIEHMTETRLDLPTLESLHKGPGKEANTDEIRLAYLTCHAAVTYLIVTHGTSKLPALIDALAETGKPAKAFDRVQLDYNAFIRQFPLWLLKGAKTGRVKLTQKIY
jgi:tetratricopeptide (TPR) repeat protein